MDLSGWWSQTVTVAHLTGYTGTGSPSYGAQVAIPARVEPHLGLVRDRNGEQVPCSHKIAASQSIGIEDRIWLPGDATSDATIAKKPIKVTPAVGKYGDVLYYEVIL